MYYWHSQWVCKLNLSPLPTSGSLKIILPCVKAAVLMIFVSGIKRYDTRLGGYIYVLLLT